MAKATFVPGWTCAEIPRQPKDLVLPVQMNQVNNWCWDNVGEGIANFIDAVDFDEEDYVWCMDTWYGFYRYQFKNEADAIMFKLRWA